MYRSTRILRNSDWLGCLGTLLGHLTATRDGLLSAGASARAKRAQRIPRRIENGNPSMPENLVMTSAYASARTGSTGKTKDRSSWASWIYLKSTTKQHYSCKKLKTSVAFKDQPFSNWSSARWRYFIITTRILQHFAFLCKIELLLFKLRWDYQIYKNERNSNDVIV